MWSVWSERVDVYLGTGLVLVQRPGVPLWTFVPPATWPLVDVLGQVDQALDRGKAKPWRLHVCLSAALCPPVGFVAPAGVSRHAELLAIARASAAQAWDMPADQAAQIVCSLDARHQGLAAAMLEGTHRVIARWATEQKGQLASLRPIWAAATAAKACAGSQVADVAVLEPDALTVLSLQPTAAMRVRSFAGRYDAADAVSRVAEMCDQEAESERRTGVAMRFTRESAPNLWTNGPSVWAKHWSALP